ncbi:MAG TPA: 3-dehydroquinate synthase [Granulicella sp.]|nr:3-dehydroquinate synthase [Granulicella sp.]
MPTKPLKPASIPVTTPSAAYQVHIGADLLPTLAPRLRKLLGLKPTAPLPRLFVVTAPEIWGLWSKAVLASFKEAEAPTVLFLPPGERNKRLSSVESLAQQLALAGADRDSILLALGGGVLGDLTGFLAAIYMRGIRYLQLPTTLLAQVDSSIGGKTGANLLAGKNLIGSFHHPLAVLADTATLATLPPAELRAGLQESIKAGIIRDPKLFRFMEDSADTILASNGQLDPAALARVVTASVRVKAEVVSKDEKESGLRMILNFGHTLGHAIETATNYKQLLHGEAVAWGSIAATYLSQNRGVLSEKDSTRIVALILRYGPLPAFTAAAERLVALTYSDKKARSGRRAFILATGIGRTEIVYDVTDAELLDAANQMLTLMRETTRRKPTQPKQAKPTKKAAPRKRRP